jgi:hypothetical protein
MTDGIKTSAQEQTSVETMVMIINVLIQIFMASLAGIADPNQGGIFRPREIVSFPFDLV